MKKSTKQENLQLENESTPIPVPPKSEEFQKFESLVKQVLSVSKEELNQRMQASK